MVCPGLWWNTLRASDRTPLAAWTSQVRDTSHGSLATFLPQARRGRRRRARARRRAPLVPRAGRERGSGPLRNTRRRHWRVSTGRTRLDRRTRGRRVRGCAGSGPGRAWDDRSPRRGDAPATEHRASAERRTRVERDVARVESRGGERHRRGRLPGRAREQRTRGSARPGLRERRGRRRRARVACAVEVDTLGHGADGDRVGVRPHRPQRSEGVRTARASRLLARRAGRRLRSPPRGRHDGLGPRDGVERLRLGPASRAHERRRPRAHRTRGLVLLAQRAGGQPPDSCCPRNSGSRTGRLRVRGAVSTEGTDRARPAGGWIPRGATAGTRGHGPPRGLRGRALPHPQEFDGSGGLRVRRNTCDDARPGRDRRVSRRSPGLRVLGAGHRLGREHLPRRDRHGAELPRREGASRGQVRRAHDASGAPARRRRPAGDGPQARRESGR